MKRSLKATSEAQRSSEANNDAPATRRRDRVLRTPSSTSRTQFVRQPWRDSRRSWRERRREVHASFTYLRGTSPSSPHTCGCERESPSFPKVVICLEHSASRTICVAGLRPGDEAPGAWTPSMNSFPSSQLDVSIAPPCCRAANNKRSRSEGLSCPTRHSCCSTK